MSLLSKQTNITPNDYFFQLANVSSLVSNNISAITVRAGLGSFDNISSLNISSGSLAAGSISTGFLAVTAIETASIVKAYEFSSVFTYADEGTVSTLFTQHIILDQATLDVIGGTVLLLNGNPIATTNVAISSLSDWAAFPAICTLKMSGSNIENAGNIYCQNIYNSLNVQTDTASVLTSLTSPSATFTNSRVNSGLSTVNFVASNAILSNVSSVANRGNTYFGNQAIFSSLNTNAVSTGTINGGAYVSGSNWWNYPAGGTVSMNQNTLNGGSNFSITGSNITIVGSNQLSNTCRDFTVVADEGINIASVANVNLTAQNGTYGAVNITANGGFNNGVNGVVNITANGSQVAGVGQGGTVNITANTPLGFSNLTSKIAINASGVNSYAGAIPPVASLAGYNYIHGDAGVNITAGLPSVFPNIPLTCYLYGTAGVTTSSDFYCPTIYPYFNGVTNPPDLAIQGRITNLFNQVYVTLSNVKYLDMDFFALIRKVKGINFCNTNGTNYISNADTIQGSNSISGYNSISATNVGFTTATGTTVNSSNVNTSNIVASNTINGNLINGNIITGSNYVSTLGLNISSINGFAAFGSKSIRVQGDVAQVQLSNTTGQKGTLNLLMRQNYAELQSFNSNFTTPLDMRFKADNFAFNLDTQNIVGGIEVDISGSTQIENGFLRVGTRDAAGTEIYDQYINISTIKQPVIQWGKAFGSGGSGDVLVTLSTAYGNSNYVVLPVMEDPTPARMSAAVLSRSTFRIYWANAGGGAQTMAFSAMGDL